MATLKELNKLRRDGRWVGVKLSTETGWSSPSTQAEAGFKVFTSGSGRTHPTPSPFSTLTLHGCNSRAIQQNVQGLLRYTISGLIKLGINKDDSGGRVR